MDGNRFDDLTRRLAGRGARRGVLIGLAGAIAGLAAAGRADGACPPGQIGRRGVCVCKTTGRPPSSERDGCPCPSGLTRCDGVCVDLARDIAHCGGCGFSCDDGDACTRDVCRTGQCRHEAIVCDDGLTCTSDRCDPTVGCVYEPDHAACDDGNPCTTNRCDVQTGCQTTNLAAGLSCSDGVFCNGLEVCNGFGECVDALAVDCGPCLTCVEATPHCVADPTQNSSSCGSSGHVCADGACVCPADKRECDGTCRECCADAHCPESRPDCQAGVCNCLGSGLACGSSAQCCPGNLCSSGFCCTRAGQQCVTPEQCCSGGCDFDSDLLHRVCG